MDEPRTLEFEMTRLDMVGPEHHELSGRANDLGSAAVFITLVLNVAVWDSFIINNFLYHW